MDRQPGNDFPIDGHFRADPRPGPAFDQLLGTMLRGKWIIAVSFIVFLLAALLYLQFATPVYVASAQILVNAKSPESSLLFNALRQLGDQRNIAQNELLILKSKSLATEVAEILYTRKYFDSVSMEPLFVIRPALDSGYSPATIGQVTGLVSASVDFEVVPETDVITISAQSRDGREAALIANTYAEVYSDRNIRASRSKSRAFREFLEAQVLDKRKRLSGAEDLLTAYMRQNNIVSLDDESKKLVDQLARLEAQRDETDLNIRSLTTTIASYESQLPDQESKLAREIGEANDPYIRLLQEQLATLEVQRDVIIAQNPSLAGKEIYNDKLKEIDDQIGTLRGNLQKRTNDFIKTIMPGEISGASQRDPASYLKSVKEKIVSSKIELQALQARMAALNKTLAQYETHFAQIPEKSAEFARLERAKLSNEKLFLMLQEKYNEAIITEQSEFGYVDIIDHASVPPKPSRPKALLILLLGSLGGLGFGVAAVFVKERLDVKVHAPDELKRQGYVVAGTIMHIPEKTLGGMNGRRLALDSPFSSEAESFRHLRTNLTYARREQPLRTILITSSKPGEGKTTVVSNLAIALAQSGKSVVLVDADLRKPALHGIFGLPAEPGLSDHLNDKSALPGVVQSTSLHNLFFIGSGTQVDNPAEILGSAAMERCLKELKTLYDMILIDTSPVLAGTDPSVLSAMADEVIVVASAGNTRLNEIEQAVELIEQVIGKKPTVILNNFDVRRAYGISYGHSGFRYYNDYYQRSSS